MKKLRNERVYDNDAAYRSERYLKMRKDRRDPAKIVIQENMLGPDDPYPLYDKEQLTRDQRITKTMRSLLYDSAGK